MLADLKKQYRYGSIITKLLLLNIIIFVVQSIVLLFFSISGNKNIFLGLLQFFYFPSSLKLFLQQPWSIFTYQFLHDPQDIFHILFNMLYLYFFGRILNDFLNRKYILPLYLTGGIAGAALFMFTAYLAPALDANGILVGASASILAIVVAAATLVPDFTVFLILIGPVKLKWIALFAVLINIVSISAGSNIGGSIAHIGGALTGYLYIKSYRNGYNWFGWIITVGEKIKNNFSKQPRVVYRNKSEPSSPGHAEKNKKQERTDAILDKISKSGYESLSKEEKDFLFKISNEK